MMIYVVLTLWLACTSVVDESCTCAEAKLHSEWCTKCAKGYVAGIAIESEFLFEVIHPHGHVIDPKQVECSSCQTALENDGFCEQCRIGFVNKEAYFSELPHQLAKGEPMKHAQIECPVCREHTKRYGWCDACRRGMVGPVAIRDRAGYKTAVTAYEIVLAAIRIQQKCKWCAAAMVADGFCPTCKKRYKGGKPVEKSDRTPTPNAHPEAREHDED